MNTIELTKFINDFGSIYPLETPVIRVSSKIIKYNLSFLKRAFENIKPQVFFPVKTNNNNNIIDFLNKQGLNFEIASLGELTILASLNILPERIIFSNPVKIGKHIEQAYAYGIRTFAFDSREELEKIAILAPNAYVYSRLSVDNSGSPWKLDQKFGVNANEIVELSQYAITLGLTPVGISFHVGWNNPNVETWYKSTELSEWVLQKLHQVSIQLKFLNIGGGFPAHLCNSYLHLQAISNKINGLLGKIVKDFNIQIYCEPGSFIVANAGVMFVSIYQILERNNSIWLYVDSGICQGFYWILSGLEYKISILGNNNMKVPLRKYIICGPTCDSHDVFAREIELPSNLSIGDILIIEPAGAYISSSINYNGFSYPITQIVL